MYPRPFNSRTYTLLVHGFDDVEEQHNIFIWSHDSLSSLRKETGDGINELGSEMQEDVWDKKGMAMRCNVQYVLMCDVKSIRRRMRVTIGNVRVEATGRCLCRFHRANSYSVS